MGSYSFIQVIAVAGAAAFVAMGLVVPIEAKAGLRAAYLTLRVALWGFVAVATGAIVVAVATGEWSEFAASHGVADLAQVLGFFGAFIFIVYYMGSRHIAYKIHSYRKDRE